MDCDLFRIFLRECVSLQTTRVVEKSCRKSCFGQNKLFPSFDLIFRIRLKLHMGKKFPAMTKDKVTRQDCMVAICKRTFPVFFSLQRTDRMPTLLGTFNWQCNCWVLGGDKTLNVLSRLFRNVGEELSDPYVLFHMARLSGPFRSHPNQCVSLELAVHAACGGIGL